MYAMILLIVSQFVVQATLSVLPSGPVLPSWCREASDGFSEPVDVEFISERDGTTQKYVRLLPADFNAKMRHDVLVALHGHGSDRWQFVEQNRPECRELRRIAADRRMILISPDYRAPASWLGPAAEDDLLQIIDELHGQYRIRNVVVAGGSMGGTSALAFAALHPECVDGVVSLNGTANLLEYSGFQDAIKDSYGGSKEEHPEVYRTRSAELFPERLTMPLAVTTGGMDAVVPPDSVLRLMSELQSRGTQVKSIHRPEGGHDTNAEDTIEALTFVLDAVSNSSIAAALTGPEPSHSNERTPDEHSASSHKIVCLGDSVTGVYYHTGGRSAYPEMLEVALKSAVPDAAVTVINAGISGHTTRDGLNRLENDVLRHHPQIVTVSFGLNDVTRIPEAEFRGNLLEIVNRCKAAGARVVLCTPNAVIDTADRPIVKLTQYCGIIREVAIETGSVLCDQFAAGERLKQRAPRTWRLTMSDAIHPNMAGHKRMAEELCRTLSGVDVSIALEQPSSPLLPRTLMRMQAGQPVKVMVMGPLESSIRRLDRKIGDDSLWDINVWDIAGKSLPELASEAQHRVRPQKPDLVILTLPIDESTTDLEQRIHAISWIMNWSLDFGMDGWDCIVVDPSVIDSLNAANHPRECELIRTLVRAQHLPLVELANEAQAETRPDSDRLYQWLKEELQLPQMPM